METGAMPMPERDLEAILVASEAALANFRGASVFIAGGTGFVGAWLTESFLWANRRLALGARLTILTREPAHVSRWLGDRAVEAVIGDVRTFDLALRPDAVINAATPAIGHGDDPTGLIDTIVDGTRNLLRVAARSGSIPVLFTSSGAVYGAQPPALERVPETYSGGPNPLDPRFAYHEAKRMAELLHVAQGRRSGILPKIARLFAFVGPGLPIDAHFAIGNFIRDALRGGPIVVSSDGTPFRSYLYASDMTTWLWHIFVRGQKDRAYNVGSANAVTVADAALIVASSAGLSPDAVEIRTRAKQGRPADRYVPDVERATFELGLTETVDLATAAHRTLAFWRAAGPAGG